MGLLWTNSCILVLHVLYTVRTCRSKVYFCQELDWIFSFEKSKTAGKNTERIQAVTEPFMKVLFYVTLPGYSIIQFEIAQRGFKFFTSFVLTKLTNATLFVQNISSPFQERLVRFRKDNDDSTKFN